MKKRKSNSKKSPKTNPPQKLGGLKAKLIAAGILFSVIIGGIVVIAAFGTKAQYNSLIQNSPSALEIKIESTELQQLRQEIEEGRWEVLVQTSHDLEPILGNLGLPKNMEGLIELYTYKTELFQWTNRKANRRNVEIALARSTLATGEDESEFHLNKDKSFGVIFVTTDFAHTVQQTEAGIVSRLLIKQDPESPIPIQNDYSIPSF